MRERALELGADLRRPARPAPRRGPRARASRSSAASGAYGRSPPSRRRHSPRSTAIPRSRASRSASRSRRLLPMPASPMTSVTVGSPSPRPLERVLQRIELRAALHEAVGWRCAWARGHYPPAMARIVRQTEANECRRCSTYCDRVIAPAACVAQRCPFLYSYDEPLSGRRFMGCMHKVFATEIDVELFRAAERTRAGFGTVRLAGYPRPAALRGRASARGLGRALQEPALLRLARRGPRRDPRFRPARPLAAESFASGGLDRQEPGIRCRRPGRARGFLDEHGFDSTRKLRLRPGLRPRVR